MFKLISMGDAVWPDSIIFFYRGQRTLSCAHVGKTAEVRMAKTSQFSQATQ